MDTNSLSHAVICAALPLIGGFTGAYEAALQGLSMSQLEDLLEEKNRKKGWFLRSVLKNTELMRMSAAFISNLCYSGLILYTFFSFVLPHAGTASSFLDLKLSWPVIAAAVATAVTRSIAEAIGEMWGESMVVAGAMPICLFTAPFIHINMLILGALRLIARGAGFNTNKSQEELEEEVIAAVTDGELAGIVNLQQREMIERVFDFDDTDVADIFTPRTEMVSIENCTSMADAIKVAIETGHSRLPVYKETRDHISGIFYVRDALKYWDENKKPELDSLVRKPLFVPETKNVVELLKEMQRSHTQIAIVLDEYGGTAGLVTIEDVIEEIVGEIRDEYDHEEDDYFIKSVSRWHVLADGHVHVSDINKSLGETLIPEDEDYETIGGFVLYNLGHIPRSGEEFTYNGDLHVKTVNADERRVLRVEVRRENNAAPAE